LHIQCLLGVLSKLKRPGHEAEYLLPFIFDFKNEWSYIPVSLYAFVSYMGTTLRFVLISYTDVAGFEIPTEVLLNIQNFWDITLSNGRLMGLVISYVETAF
jgi:hypothetical protein